MDVSTVLESPSQQPDLPAAPERFKVGTLTYTKFGLVTLFLWILWGDFCFTLMSFIKPNILPLMMRDIGASNRSIALITISIPSLMTMLFLPFISVKSDRFRSRWGRRIPFLLVGTPFLTLFLILIGFSGPIARWLHGLLGPGQTVSPQMVALCTIGFFVICSQFFELLAVSAYMCLINDVVPEAFLARFLALFSIIGRLSNFVFCMFILGNALTHTRAIFVTVSLLFLVAFMLIAWRVKEGSYPPPPPLEPGGVRKVTGYFRECFGRPYYVFFFLGTTFFDVAGTVGVFQVFFIQSIGMTLEQYGQIAAWTGIPVLLLMYPAGALVDRIHPLRAVLLCLIGYNLSSLAMLVFARGLVSYAVLSCFGVVLTAVFTVAKTPMYMRLLPKDRYGQFASAAALISSAAIIIFSYAGGAFMDWVRNYRYIFVWNVLFQSLGFGFLYLVYRHWRVHGDTRDDKASPVAETAPETAHQTAPQV